MFSQCSMSFMGGGREGSDMVYTVKACNLISIHHIVRWREKNIHENTQALLADILFDGTFLSIEGTESVVWVKYCEQNPSSNQVQVVYRCQVLLPESMSVSFPVVLYMLCWLFWPICVGHAIVPVTKICN